MFTCLRTRPIRRGSCKMHFGWPGKEILLKSMIEPTIEYTADGSPTLLHPQTGESYHSMSGAVGESLHVFIDNGLCEAAKGGKKHISIFEMGFGSGLNAWLTLDYARTSSIDIEYSAVEKYPVKRSVAGLLDYTDDPLFAELHKAPWGVRSRITDNFSLLKTECGLESMVFDATFDLVYYDAFAPESQPELWTAEIFRRFFVSLADGGLLVTYSAKGSVKQALRDAGFQVRRRQGALGKRHMVVAVKPTGGQSAVRDINS